MASPVPMPAAALEARCAHPNNPGCSPGGQTTPAGGFVHPNPNAIRRNGIYLGMFPNQDETLCELEKVVNAPFAFYGMTVQLTANQVWTATEVWNKMEDLKKADAILQLSIIPDSSWYGLTANNDCQAVAIAKEVKRIQDAMGTAVWLRFAPEMNCMPQSYYAYRSYPTVTVPFQQPIPAGYTGQVQSYNAPVRPHEVPARKRDIEGSHTETADSRKPTPTENEPERLVRVNRRHAQATNANPFVTAWHLVYKAVKAEAPDTKMIWSPGYASDMEEYHRYYPSGAPPDMVGLSYEPSKSVSVGKFLGQVRPFHDKFATYESPFLVTRTAPNINKISENNRIKFLNIITHKKVVDKLPYYMGATYHNFNDNVDKRIVILAREPELEVGTKASMNRKTKAWVQASR